MPQTVASSDFLLASKSRLGKLLEKLAGSFEYASVLGTDVSGKTYEASSRLTNISDVRWCERGFVVRTYRDGSYCEYAFNEMPANESGIEDLASRITQAAQGPQSDAFRYPKPEEESLTKAFHETVEVLPEDTGPDKIIARLAAVSAKMRSLSPLVVEAQVRMSYARVSKIFISAKKDLEQNYIFCEGMTASTARRGENTRSSFKGYSGMKGLEITDEMESGAQAVVETSCRLLDAKPMVPGEYDVICSPKATGIIAHEAFGHGVELDMFVKNRANAKEYMGKTVASSLVRMHDGAKSARQVSSYLFDDEGNLGSDTLVIENGILRAGISDALSAARLGLPPTGNGKRQSYANKAYSRMTNTLFESGSDTLEEMIASIKHGYLIEDAHSGMEDPKDWGIQCMFVYAKEIADGKVTDNWVTPVVMTGYVPDLLKAISMVSGDMKMNGSGACGKGYKEWVKVSDGGPYIKTKARLG